MYWLAHKLLDGIQIQSLKIQSDPWREGYR